ncbi:alpha/beta fold hydrolase [Haloferax sp. MBLA0076]|uniref:Alpha/beta fold hydrolase n=1 Tax=Haloferax litoreum TaxID=2666140 RepID=A0A6A8GI92_9EURY|nr:MULTISPECIES: alpha/beta fold hydrolase [Haloferax]KAB1193664.1 alpha/beta fold hydrolase [Haloferax sp. CBA1148]MRX22192.1 alpha/beta fold hydrolase [Haloferax litoreum]
MSTWRHRGEPPAARGPRRPSHFDYSRVSLTFESDGIACAGWLYRPDGVETPPVVVMAGELAAERRFGLRPYAERLAEAGYAAFLFDYRNVGDSDGEPRNLVAPDEQVDDWHAALEGLRERSEIDGNRIVLWGAGLSGGYALRVAAEDTRVAAVVAQNPMLDGSGVMGGRGVRGTLAALGAGVRDKLQSRLLGPYRVPVLGDGTSMSVFEDTVVRGEYRELVPPGSTWRDETPARVFLSMFRYRALSDPDAITCPVLLVAGTRDELAPTDDVASLADELTNATLVELPAGHFDHYDRTFEQTFGHLLSFLQAVA